TESVGSGDGSAESCSQRRRVGGAKIIHVESTRYGCAAARDREHASVTHRKVIGVHAGKSEGIVAVVESARQCLRVHASAGGCRPVKLNDEGVVQVHKLNAQGFDAAH